jgi:hypothetical protein
MGHIKRLRNFISKSEEVFINHLEKSLLAPDFSLGSLGFSLGLYMLIRVLSFNSVIGIENHKKSGTQKTESHLYQSTLSS